jgi:hypothetical protein
MKANGISAKLGGFQQVLPISKRSQVYNQVRRSLAFTRRDDTKVALGWWGLTVYNWCRPHRALRLPLA